MVMIGGIHSRLSNVSNSCAEMREGEAALARRRGCRRCEGCRRSVKGNEVMSGYHWKLTCSLCSSMDLPLSSSFPRTYLGAHVEPLCFSS